MGLYDLQLKVLYLHQDFYYQHHAVVVLLDVFDCHVTYYPCHDRWPMSKRVDVDIHSVLMTVHLLRFYRAYQAHQYPTALVRPTLVLVVPVVHIGALESLFDYKLNLYQVSKVTETYSILFS